MSEAMEWREALAEQLDRGLTDLAGPEVLRATETGVFATAAWDMVAALGLPWALVPEARGGSGLGWADLVPMLRQLGRHGAPVPLGEAVLANHILALAGLDPVEGVIGVEDAAGGDTGVWPCGRHAQHLLRLRREGDGLSVSLQDAAGLHWQLGRNVGREPRDRLAAPGPIPAGASLPSRQDGVELLGGALLRSLQICGAAEEVLAMTIDYALLRRQFGREIGRFQAVQQALARMAGEVAACGAAAEGAAAAADRRGLVDAELEIAAAKVMAGEAASVAAEVAHQIHGAIGITDEHRLHLLTRRLWSWRAEFGSDAFWARRLGGAAIIGGGGALWRLLTLRDDETPPAGDPA